MSPDIESEAQTEHQTVDKGKGKARDVTERTPLLGTGSSSRSIEHSRPLARRRLGYRLLCIFVTTLLICILALAILITLAWSYSSRASDMSPDDILHEALVLQGPDRVDVLNISQYDGIWVNVEGRIGLDAGAVVGVNPNPDGDGFLDRIWKSLGRWGVRNLDQVSVRTSAITITSDSDTYLATLELAPLEIPLTVDPPADTDAWLQHISAPVFLRPTADTSHLLRFAQDSWKNGRVAVRTKVTMVDVRGGGLAGQSWKNRLHRQLSDVKTALSVKIPDLPGLPHPGRNAPAPSLAELVTLRSFQLSNDADNLTIQALATIVDPAPTTLNLTTPSLPFVVSLISEPYPLPIASVNTAAFGLTHPNITLNISGHVLPLTPTATSTLSGFISRYLSGQSNPISIATPLISGMTVEVMFPGPDPKPRILRNVTIRDMKIKPGNTFLASGTVLARVVLPKGMNVDLDVKRVLPDVMVFDGEVPDDAHTGLLPAPAPLPDPLPEGAFGRIRPDDWLISRCVASDSEDGEGSTFAVSAKIVDVPLEVLPGRQKEFSDFVSKIVFGKGAVAGILGTAAVGVDVRGIPIDGPNHEDGIELDGLPFRGSVKLGKGNLYHSIVTGTADKWKSILRKLVPHHHLR